MSFYGLIHHFFLSLNNTVICCLDIQYLIHSSLRDILVAPKLWQLKKCCCKLICTDFSVSLKFSTRSGKYQGSTGLHDKNMFSFLRNHQTVFQSSCTIFHPPWQCMRVTFALHLPSIWCQYSHFGHSNSVVVSHCFNLHFPVSSFFTLP